MHIKSARAEAREVAMPENRRKAGFRGPHPNVGAATQFKPGQSGNPGGRPKKSPLADACRELLNNPVPEDPSGRTYAEAIAEQLAERALAGDIRAVREIADRAEGKTRMPMELSGPEGRALELRNMTHEQFIQQINEVFGLDQEQK